MFPHRRSFFPEPASAADPLFFPTNMHRTIGSGAGKGAASQPYFGMEG
jgi:hypothetical protein